MKNGWAADYYVWDEPYILQIKKYFYKKFDIRLDTCQAISFAISSMKLFSGLGVLKRRYLKVFNIETKVTRLNLKSKKKVLMLLNKYPLEFGNDYRMVLSTVIQECANSLK